MGIRARQLLPRVVLYTVLISLAILYFFPLYWMIVSSFKTPGEVSQWPPTFIPQNFTAQPYVEVWNTFTFGRWFINSLVVSCGVTLLTVFLSSLAAFAFAYYSFPGKTFFFMYILSTLMVPMHVRMIPTFLLINWFGWMETYQGLIVPQAATLCGLGVFLLRQFYVGVPRDLVDSARIDGCSELQIYFHVGLPLVKPAMVALGIYVTITSWNNFIWPLLVVQSESMKTLPLGLVSILDIHTPGSGVTWPQRMAAAALIVAPIVLLYAFFRNLFVKGITLTGIKG